ncbi:hypothetical protein EVB32_126 [Rhizobium phage RHph_TM39]|nr:hypothetical protein EVB94_126 [Rhizobium phage RHph_TM40]QIG71960.1 hypothetical protein EVB95_126 [Rhizobium phage RHph_TM2_3B]QIG72322.1 hypothetical protein EVB96_126 [Rhizobium phage RHph_TM3_3_6]QIG77114.1 hypothetical protein EVB32_126 [Rhizobium phage RHph_TM39]
MIYRVWYWSSNGYWKHFQDHEKVEAANECMAILMRPDSLKPGLMHIVPKNHPFTDRVVDMTENFYIPEDGEDFVPSEGQIIYGQKAIDAFNPTFNVVSKKSSWSPMVRKYDW